jgi:Na+-translocating ferredoxin:NAD+ oxidoreductase RnfG subunit
MKKEKLILSLFAVLFGLLVAGSIFYFFQITKTASNANTKTISFISPSPTSTPAITLTLDAPKDEEVVGNKVLTVSGKTQSNAVVIVVTDSSEDVVIPLANGTFSTTINLDNGQNTLEVFSIAPNGESISSKRTVTYSQEEF